LNPTARRVGWGLSALLAFAPIALAQSPGPEEIVTLLAKGPARGAPNAPVTIIELSDFQCTFCGKFWKETLPRLEAEYVRSGKVRLVYRHLAILGTQSVAAAQAADCAGEQGRFWEYHDRLFASMGPFALANGRLKAYAGEIGLDVERFRQELGAHAHLDRVEADRSSALASGATGTPTIFVDGLVYLGSYERVELRRTLSLPSE